MPWKEKENSSWLTHPLWHCSAFCTCVIREGGSHDLCVYKNGKQRLLLDSFILEHTPHHGRKASSPSLMERWPKILYFLDIEVSSSISICPLAWWSKHAFSNGQATASVGYWVASRVVGNLVFISSFRSSPMSSNLFKYQQWEIVCLGKSQSGTWKSFSKKQLNNRILDWRNLPNFQLCS